MYTYQKVMPATVAQSLGIYFAQRNKGVFKNHFITFSQTPQLVEIKGNDIYEKVNYCIRYNEVANTDLQKVFELILNTTVKHNLPQEEMSSKLYIISDMEFDYCVKNAKLTQLEYAKSLFESKGYQLPKIVFWNVQSRNNQQPVTMNEQGVALVSGCTPKLFSMVALGEFSPYSYMMEVLSNERYKKIIAH